LTLHARYLADRFALFHFTSNNFYDQKLNYIIQDNDSFGSPSTNLSLFPINRLASVLQLVYWESFVQSLEHIPLCWELQTVTDTFSCTWWWSLEYLLSDRYFFTETTLFGLLRWLL